MDALLEQRIQYLERLLSTKTRSPIVIQLASLYLEAGRPHDALRYCDNAIAHFPYYTTAHLMRARVLSALEMKAEARREFEFVHSVLPDVEAVKARLNEIPASESETFEEPLDEGSRAEPIGEQPLVEEEPPHSVEEMTEPSTEEALVESSTEETNPAAGWAPEEDAPVGESLEGEHVPVEQETSQATAEEDPFGLEASPASPPEIAEAVVSTDVAAESPIVNSFDDLGPVDAEPSLTAEREVESTPTFEEFADTMRSELSGSEGTMSIDEFLAAGSEQPEAEETTTDEIGELAEKLQQAPKITPIIDITEKKTPPPSEEDTPASTGFVTPTLAEIYAKQGWYDDAIVAYRTLARIKPAERERFERRIKELEEMKRSEEQGG